MDLFKRSSLEERYRPPAMEGLASLFIISWGGSRTIRNMLKFIVR